MSVMRVIRTAALLGLSVITGAVWAAADEGIDYLKITPAMPTKNKDKIEVIEAFSYGCPHCDEFEPSLNEWKKKLPKNVEFIRFHVRFVKHHDPLNPQGEGEENPNWRILAHAFYTAEALGVTEKIHKPLFDALHRQRRDLFSSPDKMQAFFAEHGVSKQQYYDAAQAFSVLNKFAKAEELTRRYQVDGVPTLIINGKYRTSGKQAGSYADMLKSVDELIAREAKK